uniref:MPN domain-containing protein n=1 Tax=Syphacia muris TaxID=451379 RepID=A0A0N5AUA7_9BILA
MEIQITTHCYLKMILHALKYPHCAVLGLIIGDESSISKCVDAIPVIHESASLVTALEAALLSVLEFCERNSHTIIGVYFSNERYLDNGLDQFAQRAATKVALFCKKPILLQIDNSRLSADEESHALIAYEVASQNWTPIGVALCNEEAAIKAVRKAMQNKCYRKIIDFENHLEDPLKDFFNVQLSKELASEID